MTEIAIDDKYILPKHADIYHLSLNISKNKIESILRNVLIKFCQVNVLGYNNSEDYYWFKINQTEFGSKIIPYVELKLINNYDNNTNIFFIAKTDNLFTKQRAMNNKIIKKFVERFETTFNNYQPNVDIDVTL